MNNNIAQFNIMGQEGKKVWDIYGSLVAGNKDKRMETAELVSPEADKLLANMAGFGYKNFKKNNEFPIAKYSPDLAKVMEKMFAQVVTNGYVMRIAESIYNNFEPVKYDISNFDALHKQWDKICKLGIKEQMPDATKAVIEHYVNLLCLQLYEDEEFPQFKTFSVDFIEEIRDNLRTSFIWGYGVRIAEHVMAKQTTS